MGVTDAEFYDDRRIAIVPMGFCFPGLNASGGDLPPRRECAPAWRDGLFRLMPQLELILLVGAYAQHWHIPGSRKATVGETVATFESRIALESRPLLLPLPHPSWRNTAWIRANPWFEARVLPVLKEHVRRLL